MPGREFVKSFGDFFRWGLWCWWLLLGCDFDKFGILCLGADIDVEVYLAAISALGARILVAWRDPPMHVSNVRQALVQQRSLFLK